LGLDTLFQTILQTIQDWNPQAGYSTERKYRDDLIVFLQKKLNHNGNGAFSSAIWGFDPSGQHFIKKEAGRGLADIGIDDEIGIELKLNLKRKSQINRLVGQVVDYLTGYSYVIIVLCGRTDEEAVNVLKHNLKRIVRSSSSLFGHEKFIRIVSKDGSQKPRKTKKALAVL
jgi:hypothetical protein